MINTGWKGIVGLLFMGLSQGCTALDGVAVENGPPKPIMDEVETLTALYDYADRVRGLDEAERMHEYRIQNRLVTEDCRYLQACLKVVLLSVIGVKPEVTDYNRILVLLEHAAARSRGPLVTGYIRFMRTLLAREKTLYEQWQSLSQALSEKQQENQALQSQNESLKASNNDLQKQNQAFQQQIKTLEAKIAALTSIEKNLKEREQQE